jgi:hypothetical protein
MNKLLLLSFSTIMHHIANFRRITPEMLESITKMDDWHRQKIIENYDEVVCSLLDNLEDINVKTNIYSKPNV